MFPFLDWPWNHDFRIAALEDGPLQQFAKCNKPGLDLVPGGIRSVAEQPALRLVLGANLRGQDCGRKKRVAAGKTHVVRREIAPRKMLAADLVVIGFDSRVLG